MFTSSFPMSLSMVTNTQEDMVIEGGSGNALFSLHDSFHSCVLYVTCCVIFYVNFVILYYYVLCAIVNISYSVDTNCKCVRNTRGRANYLTNRYGRSR